MASRELKVVISKQSEKELEKAINKIAETGVAVKGLKMGKEIENGISVPILKILVEV